jgi:hypothetical protein
VNLLDDYVIAVPGVNQADDVEIGHGFRRQLSLTDNGTEGQGEKYHQSSDGLHRAFLSGFDTGGTSIGGESAAAGCLHRRTACNDWTDAIWESK